MLLKSRRQFVYESTILISMLLLRWENETRKFGFIKRLDKSQLTNVKDLESQCFERQPFIRTNFAVTLCKFFPGLIRPSSTRFIKKKKKKSVTNMTTLKT